MKWGRWIAATVPGDVHLDLMNAHLIPDPLVSDNSKKSNWIEEKDWWYKKQFHIGEEFITSKVEIVFEGLDLTADIWLNGYAVGKANNMFIEHRFDITEFIKPGINGCRRGGHEGQTDRTVCQRVEQAAGAPLDAKSAAGFCLGPCAQIDYLWHLARRYHRSL